MANELIVKTKTIIAQGKNNDILDFYGIPSILDKVVENEKNELLKNMAFSAVVIDSLNELAKAEKFIVEIPIEMREMLNSGKAVFDKSVKNPGSLTPNIRIKGETGIKGQATIVNKCDSQAVTRSLSNLAMMAMIQSIFEKLDVIENKVDEIIKGQKNDRIGSIIGSFKGFMNLYPTLTPDNMISTAEKTYIDIQKGLAQIHMQINEERKKLNGAPANDLQTLLQSITHPFNNEAKCYQKYYEDYVCDIQLYNRLILLADVIVLLRGKDVYNTIKENHKTMDSYIEQYIDDKFKKKMDYLMQGKNGAINQIRDFNNNFNSLLEDIKNKKNIKIECTKKDVEYLKLENYGSEKC